MTNVVNLNSRRTENTRAKSTKKPLFPKDDFLASYAELGITNNEALLILHVAAYWWREDKLPFPSNSTLAARMNCTPRAVQKWKEALKKKGFILVYPRVEHGRETSAIIDLSPIKDVLEGTSGYERRFVGGANGGSSTPTNGGSYPEEISSKEEISFNSETHYTRTVSTCSEDSAERRLASPSNPIPAPPEPSPPLPLECPTSEWRATEKASRGLLVHFSASVEGSTQSTKTTKSEEDSHVADEIRAAQEVIERGLEKSRQGRAKVERKRKVRAERGLIDEMDKAGGMRQGQGVQIKALHKEWNRLCQQYHQGKGAIPDLRGGDRAKFKAMLIRWGFEKTKEILEFSIEHWKKTVKVKDLPCPHLGFLMTRDTIAAAQLDIYNQYTDLKRAYEDHLEQHGVLSEPPDDIRIGYEEAFAELKKMGII